jgi:uncharacterized membrane protein
MRPIHAVAVSALFALAATAAMTLSAGTVQAQSCGSGAIPCFQGLGFLGGSTSGAASSASGVSANGSVIVGAASINGSTEGVAWVNGTISGLGTGPATGVSSDGSVVVGNGFRWTNGVVTPLSFQAFGVNSNGSVIVGTSNGLPVEWIGGTVTALQTNPAFATNSSQANAVNADGSVIVGTCCQAGGLTAAEWLNGTLMFLSSGSGASPSGPQISVSFEGEANAVNSSGSALAGTDLVFNLGGPTNGEAWEILNGTLTNLGYLPKANQRCVSFPPSFTCPLPPGSFVDYSSASGISPDGKTVVGLATTVGAQEAAFVWNATTGMQSIGAVLGSFGINMSGWQLESATAISADGSTIVGNGIDPNGVGEAWMARLPTVTSTLPYLVDTHDFDSSGMSDILWRDTAGDVGLWLMNYGELGQGTVINTSTPTSWAIVGQRDFNGDGTADILWRNSNGDVGMWLMGGTEVLSAPTIGNVPNSWSVVGTGDFNGDGKGDILWEDNQGNLGIWFMNGAAILQTAIVGQLPSGWSVAGANMSGYIFLRNTNTGEVGIWVMSGSKITQAVDFGVVPLNWTIVGIGDFDGNGSSDLLWRDNSGNVGIWLLKGTQIMATSVIGNLPLTWSIAQTGDYNGAGRSDILWVDNVGDVSVWFMNGTVVSSMQNYGNVGTSWTVQSLNAD